jgi:hypothetical protein
VARVSFNLRRNPGKLRLHSPAWGDNSAAWRNSLRSLANHDPQQRDEPRQSTRTMATAGANRDVESKSGVEILRPRHSPTLPPVLETGSGEVATPVRVEISPCWDAKAISPPHRVASSCFREKDGRRVGPLALGITAKAQQWRTYKICAWSEDSCGGFAGASVHIPLQHITRQPTSTRRFNLHPLKIPAHMRNLLPPIDHK